MADAGKPKYQKLKEHIVETIVSRQLQHGEKIFSENQLAEEFEISRHTVRQAIGELVRDGWLYRVQGKGTFVDSRPDGQLENARTIGVITTYPGDYIFPAIIRGIDSVLSREGYNIMLGCTYNRHEKERLCLENLIRQNIVGLIVEPTRSALSNPNLELYREFEKNGIPLLFIHGSYRDMDCPCITQDDVRAGYLATKHLIELGHKNIAGVFKSDDMQGHFRFEGFVQAHREAGVAFSDAKVLWFDTEKLNAILEGVGDGWPGLEADGRVSGILDDCSAVVCYNDQIAVKVMDEIRKKGMNIPNDISVVSFDDSQLAVASEVKLTTVAHPKEELGEEAAKTIIGMIRGRQAACHVKMQPDLVIRGSTGRGCSADQGLPW